MEYEWIWINMAKLTGWGMLKRYAIISESPLRGAINRVLENWIREMSDVWDTVQTVRFGTGHKKEVTLVNTRAKRSSYIILRRVWSWLRTNAGGVPNTCKSNGKLAITFSGERVSNAWATCPSDGDNIPKGVLIPDTTFRPHGLKKKGGLYL